MNNKLPSVGDRVKVKNGLSGEVHSVNVLRQKVKVIVTDEKGDKEIQEYHVDELQFKPSRRKKRVDIDDKELKELEALEREEGKSKVDD